MTFKEDIQAMLAPGAAFVQIKPRCHPTSALCMTWSVQASALVVTCSHCGLGVADLHLAPRPSIEKRKMLKTTPSFPARPEIIPLPVKVQDQSQKAKKNRRRGR